MAPRGGNHDGEVKTNQPQKKQVRRRLHTSRPYQEKLLDMAEARREIATALKHHRAAMRQANEQKELMLKQQEEQRIVSDNYNINCCFYPPAQPPHPLPLIPQTLFDGLNFPLPDQPLGLNLNLHDFGSIETSSPIVYSSSSPSSSSIPAQETPSFGKSASDGNESSSFHQSVDDEEMAEMRSNGDQHQMDSSWWLKFSRAFDEVDYNPNERSFDPLDELMKFPDWLSPTESNIPNHFSCSSKDSFRVHDLPKMDIGDIDGFEGDWLS